MKADKKKLNFIMAYSILSIVSLVSMIGFASYLAASKINLIGTGPFQIAFILSGILIYVFGIVAAFSMWYGKWKCNWCKSKAGIFGVLSIILPFCIPIIFRVIGNKKMKVQEESTQKAILSNDDEFITQMKDKSKILRRKKKNSKNEFAQKKKVMVQIIADPDYYHIVERLAMKTEPELKKQDSSHIIANTDPFFNYEEETIEIDSGSWDPEWVYEEHWAA